MERDSAFRALADPTRRRILEMLAEGDLTAGEIAQEFPVAFASVSHHLAVLKSAVDDLSALSFKMTERLYATLGGEASN